MLGQVGKYFHPFFFFSENISMFCRNHCGITVLGRSETALLGVAGLVGLLFWVMWSMVASLLITVTTSNNNTYC